MKANNALNTKLQSKSNKIKPNNEAIVLFNAYNQNVSLFIERPLY